MQEKLVAVDYFFEISWEVCNKIGGIHTVLSTKSSFLQKKLNGNYIFIGPDVWRGDTENPEFIEDKSLFTAWREAATLDGLHLRIGKWKIEGYPIAILIDFTPLISQKDAILKELWEKFGLDSISGHWDYVEPVLFGYAVGHLIESFVKFTCSNGERSIAHFHEWMTGSGILYLRDRVPSVATVFTTHATVTGRSLAGNYQPLWRDFEKFDPLAKAREFNVVSKYSLEKLSAEHADVFTTVSEVTARECRKFLGKDADIITPNGFKNSLVPPDDQMQEKRNNGRNRLRKVCQALLDDPPAEDAIFVIHSGRYEMKNKGIDVFIYSMAALKVHPGLKKEVIAFIMVPSNQIGPRHDLRRILEGGTDKRGTDKLLTHYLHDKDYDPIVQKLQAAGLKNDPEDKVKVIFVPSYLNGYDGIFNMPYYDLLAGMDAGVFPAYYEPWGYASMESIAFGIPAITTNLTGYGLWVNDHFQDEKPAIDIVNRDDDNYQQVVDHIAARIVWFSELKESEIVNIKQNARQISSISLWEQLIVHYYNAYDTALKRAEPRISELPSTEVVEAVAPAYKISKVHEPKWKTILVHKNIPQRLSALEEISCNLWWSWNERARNLLCRIDEKLWNKSESNPVHFLEKVSYTRFMELEKDQAFLTELDDIYNSFREYMDAPARDGPRLAYFSMEYGLHNSIPLYSGGLGILAGDYLKEASDSQINMVSVGLLYKFGYFRQQLAVGGEQIASYEPTDFTKIPAKTVKCADGEPLTVSLSFPGRKVTARIWRVDVGRIPLYLLDTDIDENQDQDRSITHHLYGGDLENRFKQEMLLGTGGIRALKALGIEPHIYHCNEGHAAFIGIERLNHYINEHKLVFSEALEVVRASTLFTTHTPVPAGHDSFNENLLRKYISHYPVRLNISWTQFVDLGKIHPEDPHENFSMSYLAANLSQEINGVSLLHGKVSRRIFNDLWKGYLPPELHIGYVTNGIHHDTWTSGIWKDFYRRILGENYTQTQHLPATWNPVLKADSSEIWKIRRYLRHRLVDYIIESTKYKWIKKHESPRYFIKIRERLNPDHLTVGFARRFATYKRAQLLFRDVERLSAIVNHPERPVQFLFAGKAHPNDRQGQEVMKEIITISKRPEFLGKIIFLQNYDMELAQVLVKGVDVWLNTPTRPLEASGTSGMKAAMNGVLNFSVLDGWWLEGYRPGAGWCLPEERIYDIQDFQDELDANMIYNTLEEEIVPMFYDRSKDDIPEKWVQSIKNSITWIVPRFNMRRMLKDYIDKFYKKQYQRSLRIKDNNFALARQLASWKGRMYRSWEGIEVLSMTHPETEGKMLMLGQEHTGEIVLDLKETHASSIGVEQIIIDNRSGNDEIEVIDIQELQLIETNGTVARYRLDIYPTRAGTFSYGIRIFPKHPDLPHRQDMSFVKWI